MFTRDGVFAESSFYDIGFVLLTPVKGIQVVIMPPSETILAQNLTVSAVEWELSQLSVRDIPKFRAGAAVMAGRTLGKRP